MKVKKLLIPLFVILSGYTIKKNKPSSKKDAKRIAKTHIKNKNNLFPAKAKVNPKFKTLSKLQKNHSSGTSDINVFSFVVQVGVKK